MKNKPNSFLQLSNIFLEFKSQGDTTAEFMLKPNSKFRHLLILILNCHLINL